MGTVNQLQIQKQREISSFFNDPVNIQKLKLSFPNVGMTVERMLRMVFSAIQKNPKLQECTVESLFDCAIQCATLGLEPNTPMGQAYIIPYKGEAQFQIGYVGLINLCYRSGLEIYPMAYLVREGDDFDYRLGTDNYIKHKPREGTEDNLITYTYSIAKKNGQVVSFDIMTRVEIMKVKDRSPASKSPFSPWNHPDDVGQMMKKTVFKRHAHYLPMSAEVMTVLNNEDENGINIIDIPLNTSFVEKKRTKLAEMAQAQQAETTIIDTFLSEKAIEKSKNTMLTIAQQRISDTQNFVGQETVKTAMKSLGISGEFQTLSDQQCLDIEKKVNEMII